MELLHGLIYGLQQLHFLSVPVEQEVCCPKREDRTYVVCKERTEHMLFAKKSCGSGKTEDTVRLCTEWRKNEQGIYDWGSGRAFAGEP